MKVSCPDTESSHWVAGVGGWVKRFEWLSMIFLDREVEEDVRMFGRRVGDDDDVVIGEEL